MRPIAVEEQRQEAVSRVAEGYRSEGYEVQIAPEEVPEFLRGFHPDLVITKGDQRYVVEIAMSGPSRRMDGYWASLAQRIADQPGWHFRIVVVGADDEGRSWLQTLPTAAEVEAELGEPEQLLQQGHATAALVLAWSLFEAAARLRMIEDDRDPARPSSPIALTKSLVRLGYIEQPEFEILRDTMGLRDRVAHGYFGVPVPAERVRFLLDMVRRLLLWSADEDRDAAPAGPSQEGEPAGQP
jgi:hypothetical protein